MNLGILQFHGYRPFIDSTLTANVSVIRAVHINELRQRIDAVRARYTLAPFSYTDPPPTAGTTNVLARHITELRTALSDVYLAAGLMQPVYTDLSLAAGAAIKAVHIAELRSFVGTLE